MDNPSRICLSSGTTSTIDLAIASPSLTLAAQLRLGPYMGNHYLQIIIETQQRTPKIPQSIKELDFNEERWNESNSEVKKNYTYSPYDWSGRELSQRDLHQGPSRSQEDSFQVWTTVVILNEKKIGGAKNPTAAVQQSENWRRRGGKNPFDAETTTKYKSAEAKKWEAIDKYLSNLEAS